MTAAAWIAHVLVLHLNVPEPVDFVIRDLWPREVAAQAVRHGPVGIPTAWTIQYDRVEWERRPKMRMRVLAHELCHAAYDHEVSDWDGLRYSERAGRHGRVEDCARKILRDCRAAGERLEETGDRAGRRRLRRSELEELLEREP